MRLLDSVVSSAAVVVGTVVVVVLKLAVVSHCDLTTPSACSLPTHCIISTL